LWHLADYDELCGEATVECWSSIADDRHLRVVATSRGVWLIVTWPSGASVAFRMILSPGPLGVDTTDADERCVTIRASTTLGEQRARLTVGDDDVVSFNTVLRPRTDMSFPAWPRDIVPLGTPRRPPDGVVHTHQRGLRTGLLYASLTGQRAATFMYLQDLTALGGFCEATHASASDTVGGEWPDIGFRLPAGDRSLEREIGELELSRAHVALADHVPEDPVQIAEQYLDLLARLYMYIERPTPPYVDWIDHATQTRADLQRSAECWTRVERSRYPRAYVGDEHHPPESMVLLSLLVPLLEWQQWSGERDSLADELRRRLPAFMDERTDCVARWLPQAEDMLQGDEPHEHPRLMDSWYLFHPMLNMGRLAEWSDDEARALLIRSLGLAMKVAHRFDYDWPVFYDIDTLEVIKAETEPGAGGERDVPGLYAHVMLQAWELTDDRRYLDEAIAAGRSMVGKGFELAYQINNVAFGVEAMLRLHRITGEAEFRGVAHVLAACLFDNSGLWQCLYGDAAERSTFIGIYPLTDAPYTAAYEEAEAAAACLAYSTFAGDELPSSLRVLMPEVVRHTTARLHTYYPCNIRPHVLADEPKTGHIDASLRIPVEDLGDGWAKAGTVGQEIYGAGMAFSTLVRSYVKVPAHAALVYCDYPFEVVNADESQVRLNVIGDPRLNGLLRVSMTGRRRRLVDHVVAGSQSGVLEPRHKSTYAEYDVPAGQHVFVSFSQRSSRQRSRASSAGAANSPV
jgi:hypothetical protein